MHSSALLPPAVQFATPKMQDAFNPVMCVHSFMCVITLGKILKNMKMYKNGFYLWFPQNKL